MRSKLRPRDKQKKESKEIRKNSAVTMFALLLFYEFICGGLPVTHNNVHVCTYVHTHISCP